MTRLWQISISHTSVIAAENLCDAYGVAIDQAGDILKEEIYDVDVDHEIKVAESLPAEWTVKCVPWGADDGETIEKILASQPATVYRDTKTIDMFAEAV